VAVAARYEFLQRLARAAGRRARDFRDRRTTLVVEQKGPQDFVSRADKEVETFIRRELAAAFPGDVVLGEATAATFAGARRGRRLGCQLAFAKSPAKV
jgi:myo-inositol-1(or 4)-monophosphatase